MPNGKPDPNCSECKGTGQITLFTSSCLCDCVNRNKPKPVFGSAIKQIKANLIPEGCKPYCNVPKVFIDPDTLSVIRKLAKSLDTTNWK